MEFNQIYRTAVGADLSYTPPIYRPSVAVPKYPIYFLKIHKLLRLSKNFKWQRYKEELTHS